MARERGEGTDVAATRLWAAAECMKKVGLPPEAPLVLESITPDGWGGLRSGTLCLATCAVAVGGFDPALVVAVAFRAAAAVEQLGGMTEAGHGIEI